MTGADITCQVCEARIDVGADVCPECGARTDLAAAVQGSAGDHDGEATREAEADTPARSDTDGQATPAGTAAACPDCGTSVSAQAVRCPECYTALTESGATALGGADSVDRSAGHRHAALVPLMLAGAVGVTGSVAFPDGAGVDAAVGALNLVNIVGVPLVTLLDLRRVTAAVGWDTRPELWALVGLVPAVNVVSSFLYLVRRADAVDTAD